jgi:hypothetical protein
MVHYNFIARHLRRFTQLLPIHLNKLMHVQCSKMVAKPIHCFPLQKTTDYNQKHARIQQCSSVTGFPIYGGFQNISVNAQNNCEQQL